MITPLALTLTFLRFTATGSKSVPSPVAALKETFVLPTGILVPDIIMPLLYL